MRGFFVRHPRGLGHLSLFLVAAYAPAAHALQPLETFVRGAMAHNVDIQDAQANLRQQNALKNSALGKVLPSVALKGVYTRNAFSVQFPAGAIGGGGGGGGNLVIQPLNQLDGTAVLSVPLLDFSNFALLSAANESRHAVASQGAQTGLDVSRQVAQNYYQLVANMALVEASDKALSVARASLQLTEDLFAAGKSATLDVNRAAAEVERQVQQLTLAQLQVQAVARNLASLSATVPEVSQTPALVDELEPEAPLASFMGEDEDIPGLAAVISMRKVRDMQAQAQRLNWVPKLSGAFTERFTNATGFINNRSSVYTAMVNLNWNIGLTTFADIDAADATAATARIEEARTRLAVNDGVFIGWQTVHSNIARSRSARKQQAVSAEAASLAKDRYAAGVATQLDLLQAQRDAFAADVSRIQADADLVNARIQLRLYAGRNPFASTKEVP